MNKLLLLAVLACGCGVGAVDQTPTKASTSQALKCDSEPIDNGNGVATAISCAFEQQWQNINAHGTKLGQPLALTAAGSPLGVTATNECGTWVLGTDAQGVTVFVNKTDGEVRSHGQLHPGFATTSLPSVVSLPVVGN
jgi:hypothetical protein